MSTLTPSAAADLFRSAPTAHIDVGAGEAAYYRIGTGPDVLFVHGWPVSGATFRSLLPHLVDHVTCHIIDLPSAGASRFTDNTPLSLRQHFTTVRRVVDHLDLDSVAVVGHDSGGLIARHAMVDDPRLRALGLINTELPKIGWRFRSFIAARRLPGFGSIFGWVCGQPRLRRNKFVLGDAFADRSLLEGEFDEFFLQRIHTSRPHRDAAMKVLNTFDMKAIAELADIHPRLDVPVRLAWGTEDPFFPVAGARQAVAEFPNASIEEVPGAGLFAHEERPAAIAKALLPVLL